MDTQTLLIIVIVVLLVLYLMNRGQSQSGGSGPYSEGDEGPYYDDPNIEGRGSFGRDRSNSSSYRETPRPTQRIDSPNVRGRGSFGKDKR